MLDILLKLKKNHHLPIRKLPYLGLSNLHPKLVTKNCEAATIIKLGQTEGKEMSAGTGI